MKSAHINGTDGDIRVYTFFMSGRDNCGASGLRLADDIPGVQAAFFLDRKSVV